MKYSTRLVFVMAIAMCFICGNITRQFMPANNTGKTAAKAGSEKHVSRVFSPLTMMLTERL